jgi:hypothetical protein
MSASLAILSLSQADDRVVVVFRQGRRLFSAAGLGVSARLAQYLSDVASCTDSTGKIQGHALWRRRFHGPEREIKFTYHLDS